MAEEYETIDNVLSRKEDYTSALTKGSLAANVTLGLGYLIENSLAATASSALTFGTFTFGTGLMQSATMLEQKVIGAGIAAYSFLPAYHTITKMAPILYGKLTTGIGLVKAGAYVAAIKPLAIAAGAAALGYCLIWGISKALKSLFTKKKKKSK